MLQALFGFDGHLGRLAYLGMLLVQAVMLFVIGFVAGFVGAVLGVTMGGGARGGLGFGLVMLPVFVVSLWSSVALMVKRVRDTGLPPWLVVGAAFLLCALDAAVVTRFTGLRFFPPLAYMTPFGGFVTVAFTVFLLGWPGADGSGTDSRHGGHEAEDVYHRSGPRGFNRFPG